MDVVSIGKVGKSLIVWEKFTTYRENLKEWEKFTMYREN